MRIAVIGAGRVGSALGTRWSEAGHDVLFGVRNPDDPKYRGLEVESVTEAVEGADIVVLAVPWRAITDVAVDLGELGDHIVIDATNPLTPERRHVLHTSTSGAEEIAALLKSDRVVKAFNSTGSGNLAESSYPGGTPVMLIAGDDLDAKRIVLALAADIGFDAVDAGPLSVARDLEHMATLWIRLSQGAGLGPDIAFSLLRR